MSQPKGPIIRFEKDLEFGYNKPLAKFTETVELGGGTHFLLARNGRGKTTLLRTVAGTLKTVRGELSHEGFMQYLPEDMRFDAHITPGMIFRMLIPGKRHKEAMELAERIELDTTLKKPHSLAVADMNGDGHTDIICSEASAEGYTVIYVNDGKANFTRQVIGSKQGSYDIRIVDMNGDKVPDILLAGATNRNIVWYENPMQAKSK